MTMGIPLPRAERRWQRIIDRPNPLLKQGPTLVAVALAVLLMSTIPDLPVTSMPALCLGVGLVLAATAHATVLSVRRVHDGWIVMLVPIVDIMGLGLFRTGTGGAMSIFGALVLLPAIWLAAAPGFRYVVIVGFLSSIALLTPYFVNPPSNSVDWLRGVISPLVFAAVAVVVNELSRQHRLRAEQAELLVKERTEALSENIAMVMQLRDREQEYRTLLDFFESLWEAVTAQAIIVTDRRGVIETWNPGAVRILGLPVDDALDNVRIDRFFSKSMLSMLAAENADTAHDVAPDLPSGIRELFARADAEQGADSDVEVTTAGGSIVPARVTVTPRVDSAGKHVGYLLILTDETRAVEIARMKDEFVGMISHELRTPLTAIIGFLDLLQNDAAHPLTDEQQEFASIIERNAERLLNLVGDLLFTAQVESGRFALTRREVDICEIVRSAVVSAGPHAQREGIDLAVELPGEATQVVVDGGRIGQAIDNLLSNAIKFTPRGGRVTAGVELIGGATELWVRDTGLGIPKDEQRMLFTRFFRASTATQNAVPGVGLGLTITRAIVLAHGGTMGVTSEEGVGTEFRITLPIAPRTEAIKVAASR